MVRARSSWILVALLSVAPACTFDPSGPASTIDAADAPTADALDAADHDAPIDAVDAPPIDACVPRAGGELCNGADDDCDGMIDEDFPTVGAACDGPDLDLCLDDVVRCATGGAATVCGDSAADDDVERCNGTDDNCDGTTDEGFTGLGAACDGTDGDACAEGMGACSADGLTVVCTDMTSTTTEVCNGADDNCAGGVDEGFGLGTPCDGADGDACLEGVLECDPGTGGTRCNDTSGTIAEQCNNLDDDCDAAIDETFDLTGDVNNCGLCGRVCSNSFGTTTCASSSCVPTCSAGANDCDGNPVTGCELRDSNPACAAATALGTVSGDGASVALTASGFGEAVYTVSVTENVAGNNPIRAQVTLTSPPGANFDLDVTCTSCAGTTLSSNNATGDDVIAVRRSDTTGVGDTYTIVITVRWVAAAACGNWALTVAGNTGTGGLTCN